MNGRFSTDYIASKYIDSYNIPPSVARSSLYSFCLAMHKKKQETRGTTLQLGGPDILPTIIANNFRSEIHGSFPEEAQETLDNLGIQYKRHEIGEGFRFDYESPITLNPRSLIFTQNPQSEEIATLIQGPERHETVKTTAEENIEKLVKNGLYIHPDFGQTPGFTKEANGLLYSPEKKKYYSYTVERKL